MNQCNNCDGDTSNLKTLIDGSVQVLCEDCREELVDDYESNRDDSQDISSEHGGTHADGGNELQEPALSSEWRVESIREEWNALNVRLPDSLMRRFNSYHKRLDYELAKAGSNREFGKDRHYKPLVIAFGLHAVKEMDADELTDALRALEKNQIVD